MIHLCQITMAFGLTSKPGVNSAGGGSSPLIPALISGAGAVVAVFIGFLLSAQAEKRSAKARRDEQRRDHVLKTISDVGTLALQAELELREESERWRERLESLTLAQSETSRVAIETELATRARESAIRFQGARARLEECRLQLRVLRAPEQLILTVAKLAGMFVSVADAAQDAATNHTYADLLTQTRRDLITGVDELVAQGSSSIE